MESVMTMVGTKTSLTFDISKWARQINRSELSMAFLCGCLCYSSVSKVL